MESSATIKAMDVLRVRPSLLLIAKVPREIEELLASRTVLMPSSSARRKESSNGSCGAWARSLQLTSESRSGKGVTPPDLLVSIVSCRVRQSAPYIRGASEGATMGLLRYRTVSGELKFWTLKEIVQGKSLNRVTHPVFVIFPIALYSGALVLDLLSRLSLSGAPLAATYAVLGAVIGALFSILTGLVDRSLMRPGSLIRSIATRHMYIQFVATAVFIANLAIRWFDRRASKASLLWIVLDILGVATVITGGDVGATMVFKMGYRVQSPPVEAGGSVEAEPAEAGQAPSPGS